MQEVWGILETSLVSLVFPSQLDNSDIACMFVFLPRNNHFAHIFWSSSWISWPCHTMSQDSQGSSNSHNLTGWTFHQDTNKSYRYLRSCLSLQDFWEKLKWYTVVVVVVLVGNGIETGSVMFDIHVLIFHPLNMKMAVQQETSFNHWKTNCWRLKA